MNTRKNQIEQARRLIATGISEDLKEVLEKQYPELKESEDERIKKELIGYLVHRADVTAFIDEGEDCKRWIAYLKKQKDVEIEIEKAYKNADEIQYKKGFEDGVASIEPAEWSEEDEAFLKVAIAICNRYSHKDIADWLESLRPQPHWKPNEEQMKGIECAIKTLKYQLNCGDKRLDSLYDDLKKL